jgi:hypothetical protein
MAVKKGKIGVEDIEFGTGTFTRKDRTNNDITLNQISASDIPIADSGSLYTTDDVESALQECVVNNFTGLTFRDLINKSGAQRTQGEVVIADTTADDSFTTTTTDADKKFIGIVAETIESAASGKVLLGGYVDKLNVDGATSRGDFLKVSSTEGKATPVSLLEDGVFGIALSSTAGIGQVSAIIYNASLQYWSDETTYIRPNNVTDSGNTGFRIYDAGYTQLGNVGGTTNDSIDEWHVNHSTNGDILRIALGQSGSPNTTSDNPPVWVQHWCDKDQTAKEDQVITGGLFESIKGANDATHNALVGNARCTGGTGGLIGVQGRASTTVNTGYTIVGIWAACDTPDDAHQHHAAALECNMFNNYADAGEMTAWNDTYTTIGIFCNNYTNKAATGHHPISFGLMITASELPDRVSYWGYHRGIQIEACKEYAIYIKDTPATAIYVENTCTVGLDLQSNRMRITSYTNSSPVEGDLWYDGTNLRFRDATTSRTITWT